MKQHSSVLLLFLLAMLSACSGEEIAQMPRQTALAFYAPRSIATRTMLVDGTSVEWAEGDAVAVYDSLSAKREFVAEVGENAVLFQGYITPRQSRFVAVYPFANAGDNMVGDDVQVVVPAQQTAVLGSFAVDANPAIARGERNPDGSPSQLTFRNVCQLFRFTIPAYADGRIVRVELAAANPLAGMMQVSIDETEPTAPLLQGGSKSIVLTPPAGQSAFAAGIYYMVAAPVALDGFALTLTTADGKTYTQRSGSAIGGEVGKIYNLAQVDLPETPVVSAAHVYENNLLCGTNLTLSAPIAGTEWQAVVKNAQGEVVRTIAAGTGALTSEYGGSSWPYLPQGTYTVDYIYTTSNGKQMTKSTTFAVAEKPRFTAVLNAATSYSYSQGDGVAKDVAKANQMNKDQITALSLTIQGIHPTLLDGKYAYSAEAPSGSSQQAKSNGAFQFADLLNSTLGENTLTAYATFDGVRVAASKTVVNTGLPFLFNPPRLNNWTKSGDHFKEESTYIKFGQGKTDKDQDLTYKDLYIPNGTKVLIDYSVSANAKEATAGTTFSILLGGSSEVSIKAKNWATAKEAKTKSATTKSLVRELVCRNSYSLGYTCSYLYRIGLSYAE